MALNLSRSKNNCFAYVPAWKFDRTVSDRVRE